MVMAVQLSFELRIFSPDTKLNFWVVEVKKFWSFLPFKFHVLSFNTTTHICEIIHNNFDRILSSSFYTD